MAGGAAPLLRARWAPLSAPDTDRTGHNGGAHWLATPHAPPTPPRPLAGEGCQSRRARTHRLCAARGSYLALPVGSLLLPVKILARRLASFRFLPPSVPSPLSPLKGFAFYSSGFVRLAVPPGLLECEPGLAESPALSPPPEGRPSQEMPLLLPVDGDHVAEGGQAEARRGLPRAAAAAAPALLRPSGARACRCASGHQLPLIWPADKDGSSSARSAGAL